MEYTAVTNRLLCIKIMLNMLDLQVCCELFLQRCIIIWKILDPTLPCDQINSICRFYCFNVNTYTKRTIGLKRTYPNTEYLCLSQQLINNLFFPRILLRPDPEVISREYGRWSHRVSSKQEYAMNFFPSRPDGDSSVLTLLHTGYSWKFPH